MPKDDGLAFSRPYDGQQAFNQLPPNPPNPPPSPSPSPPEVIGDDIGMPVAMTGDPWIDGRRRSAVASHRLMHHVMLPIGVTAVVVVLFLVDCAVHISATISARPNLQSNMRLALCTTSFITCSVAMTVFNKVALVAVPLPLVLVTLQMGVTVLLVLLWNAFAVCVGGRAWWQIKAGSKRDVLRWAPVSVLFAASLYTFTAALHYSTLGAVITWRNLAPLPTMLVECCCFSHARYRATCSSIVGLLVIFAGVMTYGFADSQFSVLGTSLVVVNTVVVVLETLSKRHLMTNQTNPLQLTRQAMMLVSNLIGVVLVATAAAVVGEWGKLGAELYELRAGEASYILCGGIVAALFSYAGLKLTALISATTLLTVTNASKGLVIVFGVLFLADEHTLMALTGCTLAVMGNVLYFAARLKLLEVQSLPKESEHADRTEEKAGLPQLRSEEGPTPDAALPAGKGRGKLSAQLLSR